MASNTAKLTQTAKVLKNSSPEEFQAFVNEFARYTEQYVLDCVTADAANVLLAQGGARHLQKVLTVLRECDSPPAPVRA